MNAIYTGWPDAPPHIRKLMPRAVPDWHLLKDSRKCCQCKRRFEKTEMYWGRTTSKNKQYICYDCYRKYKGSVFYQKEQV